MRCFLDILGYWVRLGFCAGCLKCGVERVTVVSAGSVYKIEVRAACRTWRGVSADGGTRRPVGGGGGLTGKRRRGRVGEAAQEAAPLVQCVLREVRVGKGIVNGQVVMRLAEVMACRRRKQARRVSEERRVINAAHTFNTKGENERQETT